MHGENISFAYGFWSLAENGGEDEGYVIGQNEDDVENDAGYVHANARDVTCNGKRNSHET